MTWTKLGDEFPDEARDLSDAEFRTHVEALCWSNRRGLDLLVPKRDLRRFAESPDAPGAAASLVARGWWEDRGGAWHVGGRFAEWQPARTAIDERKVMARERQRRHRAHLAGDHARCLPENCAVTRDVTRHVTRHVTGVVTGVVTPNVGTGREGLSDLPVPKESPSPKRGEPDDPRFGEFWTVYPRKVGKPDARKAWDKAVKGGADPQAIISGAKRYAAECHGQPAKFIKYPQGWLNGCRYDDEDQPAAAGDREDDSWSR